ncbi:platelet endothelial aggregation receptor 1-like [Hydractinia symbiolongicarpus]|uniref:platelet endothelial aggregation receptor 1-like n=1 Tax=Hydractinia symbiolongicarpus TaxID=13093 RepID=UPI002549EEBB|nr:platelet endothelial aggregation receptor 1-like [Hydractinia symbiolongicarpus]
MAYINKIKQMLCHYRNETCIMKTCDVRCASSHGKCNPQTGKCECCRGWSGPNAKYDSALDRYVADYCDKECQFLGAGVANPECKKVPEVVPPCDPKCSNSEGVCLPGGRCKCCTGWTGPNASHYSSDNGENMIVADYCNVYCPYTSDNLNQLCLRPNYIERLARAGRKITV